MKKYVYLFVYVIYNYYKTSGKYMDDAFFYTKGILALILLINVNSVILLFSHDFVMDFVIDKSRPIMFAKAIGFLVLPSYIIVSFLFKEKTLKYIEIDEQTKKKATNYAIVYFVFTILFFIAAANLRRW